MCMDMHICICAHLKGVEGQGKREGDSGAPFREKLFLVFASPFHLTRNLKERRERCQLLTDIEWITTENSVCETNMTGEVRGKTDETCLDVNGAQEEMRREETEESKRFVR